jgi:putative two-component system response regulator
MRSVGRLSAVLGATVGLSRVDCIRLGRAAALHDVGKLYLPARLLDKCGEFTPDEMATMQQHPRLGFVHLASIGSSALARFAALIALEHHENWDGSGYPEGLAGEEISLESRIVAVCDVYSALREARPYKAGMDHAAAMAELCDTTGSRLHGKFDPRILATLRQSEVAIDRAFAG